MAALIPLTTKSETNVRIEAMSCDNCAKVTQTVITASKESVLLSVDLQIRIHKNEDHFGIEWTDIFYNRVLQTEAHTGTGRPLSTTCPPIFQIRFQPLVFQIRLTSLHSSSNWKIQAISVPRILQ